MACSYYIGMANKSIPCTACGICVPQCPMELNIPALLAKYNEEFYGVRTESDLVSTFPGYTTPEACIGCCHCMIICPVGIGVPALLRELEI